MKTGLPRSGREAQGSDEKRTDTYNRYDQGASQSLTQRTAKNTSRFAGVLRRQAGYTIVEVMIVLAVTGALLVAVILTVGGQQRRTEFSQSINEIDSKIREVITHVSTGYYVDTGNFTCDAPGGGGPALHTAGGTQGQNQECIFIGRAIQFAVEGNASSFNTYNIVGQRQKDDHDVTTLDEALPTAIAPPNGADATEAGNLLYGLAATKMYYKDSGDGNVIHPINTIAFMSTLSNYTNGNLNSGSQSVQLLPVQNTADISSPASNKSAVATVPQIKAANLSLVPDGGVTICFKSGGTDKYGIIKIGTSNRQVTTTLTIQDSAVATGVGGDCA